MLNRLPVDLPALVVNQALTANYTSPVIEITYGYGFFISVYLSAASTANGIIIYEFAIGNPGLQPAWHVISQDALTNGSFASSTNSNSQIDVTKSSCKFARFRYTFTSGSANLSASAYVKPL